VKYRGACKVLKRSSKNGLPGMPGNFLVVARNSKPVIMDFEAAAVV